MLVRGCAQMVKRKPDSRLLMPASSNGRFNDRGLFERDALMSCVIEPPSRSLRDLGRHAELRRERGRAALAFAALLGSACTGAIGSLGSRQSAGGARPSTLTSR